MGGAEGSAACAPEPSANSLAHLTCKQHLLRPEINAACGVFSILLLVFIFCFILFFYFFYCHRCWNEGNVNVCLFAGSTYRRTATMAGGRMEKAVKDISLKVQQILAEHKPVRVGFVDSNAFDRY